MIGEQTGEHISKNMSKIFKLYLMFPNCVIKCKVVGNRINRGADYKDPVQNKFSWSGKTVNWVEKSVRKDIDSVKRRTTNWRLRRNI